MGLRHRKILEEICTIICHDDSCLSGACRSCTKTCLIQPPTDYYPPPSPIDLDYSDLDNPSKTHKISTVLTVAIALLAAAFFALICYAVYRRFLFGCLARRRRRTPETQEETRGDFLDEEQGPMVDHPIWYIRTRGLQQSVISAISVCKYKKGEGLIEGTECSVCLSEFEEDESLRLLPKCNHAFHIPCIDTWLRSHTNCPMCRAPIVVNPATIVPSPEPTAVSSSNSEEPQMETVENGRQNNGEVENSGGELRNEYEEGGRRERAVEEEVENLQPRRRSVSLDSPSVEKINLALSLAANRTVRSSAESSASKRVSKSRSSSFRIKSLQSVAGTSMKRSSSYNGKLLLSLYSRSQRKPSVPVRSF